MSILFTCKLLHLVKLILIIIIIIIIIMMMMMMTMIIIMMMIIIIIIIIMMMMMMMMMIIIIIIIIIIMIMMIMMILLLLLLMMMMMMMMIIIIIIIMIITIAFNGAYRHFFYNLLTASRTVSRTYVQVARAQSLANHVQHVMLRATWYEGTAQLLSLTELKSHLFELYFIG